MPAEVRDAILNFSNFGSDTGILVIRGLLVDDDLVDTPLDNKGGIGAKTTFAKQQAVLAQLLGTMIAYEA